MNEQTMQWLLIVVPIICTLIFGTFAYLWKRSIDKSLNKVDIHDKDISEMEKRLALIENDLKHFREREESLIKMFKEEIGVKIDHLNETFKLKLIALETLMSVLTKSKIESPK